MSALRHLSPVLLSVVLVGACAQLIGLGDYETGEGDDEGGSSGASGSTQGGSGGSTGGTSGGKGGSTTTGGKGGSAGKGGGGGVSGEGGAGDAGDAGQSGDSGGGGDAGSPSGGSSGRGGTGAGGTVAGMGGGGMGGKGGTGGAGSGGMGGAGSGGVSGAGSGGVSGAGGGPCTPMSVELLRNGGFDSGPTGNWFVIYNNGGPVIVAGASVGVTAQSSPNVAHYGGINDAYSDMAETITIPAGTTALTFSGYRQVVTSEVDGPYDFLYVHIYTDATDASTFLREVVRWSDVDETLDWVPFSHIVTSAAALAGQTVDFNIFAETDSSVFTDFYLDSLSLVATVCQ